MKYVPLILKSKKSSDPEARGAAFYAKYKPRIRVHFDPFIVIIHDL